MEQMNMREIEQSETPEMLYKAVAKLNNVAEDSIRDGAYREARNALIRFRKVYSKLPSLPEHRKNTIAGLQETMDWCIRAIDVVDHMVDDMDESVIEGFISKLDELKQLPGRAIPKVNEDGWRQAQERAQRIVDKYETGKKRPRGLNVWAYSGRRTRFLEATGIVTALADVASKRVERSKKGFPASSSSIGASSMSRQIEDAHTEMSFYRAVEKIYRKIDSDYTSSLTNLEERIQVVFGEWNKLSATNTGCLIDMYDTLKGFGFGDGVSRLAHSYSIESITDTLLFGQSLDVAFGGKPREALIDDLAEILHGVIAAIRERTQKNRAEKEPKTKEGMPMMSAESIKENWQAIKDEYGVGKRDFGKKINFVSDPFKRKVIFRDVERAFVLASCGFSKSALILAGGVIEELLRLYLDNKKIKPNNNRFIDYIRSCEDNNLLKRGVSRLTDSIRDFRNLVHIENEKAKKHTVSKATAKGAIASIFTIANDFEKDISK